MTKFAVFLFIIFVSALGYLAILNKESVTIRLSERYMFDIPEIALILLSCAVGALSMLAMVAVRDARRYFESLQNQRQQKKSMKVQESYSRGMDAFFAGKDGEATELFGSVLDVEPSHASALLRLGDIAFNKGELTNARDYYMRAKEVRPQSVETLYSLEKLFEAEQKWQEAQRYLDNILEIDEGNSKALYRKRDIYENNRDWESVIDTQHKILKGDITEETRQNENMNLMGYKYELGRHYLEEGSMEKAKKILKNIIKTDKDFVSAYLALAESYIRDNNAEEAENVLLKGYEATYALVFLVRLEDYFIGIGEPGRIIELYQRAIQKNPKDQKLQFFLAKLYYRLEMIDYAYETISGMDTSMADYPDLHALLGDIYERRTEHDRAAEEFRKALNSDKPLLVPFCCSHCKYLSKEWSGRCPGCKRWNTLALDVSGTCKV